MGIDIGTDTIKFVVSEYFNNKFNVLASYDIKTKGVRKGLIVDAALAVNAVKDGLKEIATRLGIEMKKTIVNVPSYNAKFLFVDAFININNEDYIIDSDDVGNLFRESIRGKIDDEYELVTVIPLNFSIDDKKGIKRPIGKRGKKLELKGVAISVPKKNIYSVLSVIDAAGLEVVDITFSGIADYYEVRNEQLDRKVGAVINIGHDTTTVSIINRGKFMCSEVLQIGGSNIERDLACVLGISIFDARTIKEKFASAHKRFSNLNEKFEVKNNHDEVLNLNQYEVSEVIMERLVQILEFAKKQILLLTNQNINYIIITGGVTEIKNFKYLAFDVLGKDVIIYEETSLGIRHNKYVTASGMLKYLEDKMELRGKEFSMISQEEENELITPKNKYKKTDIKNIKKMFNFLSNKEEI